MSIRYIFCISTGRCGTEYLYSLFNNLNNCSSFHEQRPVLNNDKMRAYLNGNKEPLKKLLHSKLDRIFENPLKLYVDTSHLFIKGFGWELPNHIPQNEIGIIVLKRDRNEVVKSTQRVQSGPFSFLGRKWIIVPYRNSLIPPPIHRVWYNIYRYSLKFYWYLKREQNSAIKTYPTFFEKKSEVLLKWYYDETYALGEKYKRTFPEIIYIDVSLDELNTLNGFEKIIKKFNLWDMYDFENIKPLIGKAKNLKKNLTIKNT